MSVGRVRAAVATVGLLVIAAASTALVSSTPVRAAAGSSAAAAGRCFDGRLPTTVEEQRLSRPVAQQLLTIGGFRPYVRSFGTALCGSTSLAAAQRVARESGQQLWRAAVDRAQGRLHLGTDDPYDDRPLYWARLSMTKALRQWSPSFAVGSFNSAALVRSLDYASRGITSVGFPSGERKRVLVSGFDPFVLDGIGGDMRHSNPSGASALQLDGRTVRTSSGPAVVQSVMLPVNYTDFDQGIVEEAFGPSLVPSARRASLIMTISQAVRGEMWVEKWAGDARGGFPDNLRIMQFGPISRAPRWPQPAEPPQWIPTALPYRAMIGAKTKPWPVILHRGICEWRVASDYPDPAKVICQPDPTGNSLAASGSGGNYLSNESMYRSNRLRIAAGALDVPGGHLHISSLVYPQDAGQLTSRAFEADRKADVDQTVSLVEAAARAIRR